MDTLPARKRRTRRAEEGTGSLGLPMVGRRHQRETDAPQSPGWGCEEIPDRICGTLSSRRSSANYQQSLRAQEPAANHNQHALGALLSRGVASQSIIHTGRVHNLREKLDCSTLGQSTTRTSQNCRGRALATGDRSADGTKAKIKCVMSALFSHAVRWEFCGHNPISSGIPVGSGGKRGPSTGVRISAKRQRSPLVLSRQARIGRTGVSGSVARVSRGRLGVYVKANSGRCAGCRAISTIRASASNTRITGAGVET
jgi:hypothetical protein